MDRVIDLHGTAGLLLGVCVSLVFPFFLLQFMHDICMVFAFLGLFPRAVLTYSRFMPAV